MNTTTYYIDRDSTVSVGEYRLWMAVEGYEPTIVASCPDCAPLQRRLDLINEAKVTV